MSNNANIPSRFTQGLKAASHKFNAAFKEAMDYLPSTAMIGGAGYMTFDAIQAGLLDVAIGGAALTAIGIELAFLAADKASHFHLFPHKGEKVKIGPGDRMAVLGFTACAALGGGETVRMIQEYNITPQNILDKNIWKQIIEDPGSIKVLANTTVYPLASVLDISRAEKFLQKHGLEKTHRISQTFLLCAGSAMILQFGEAGKIFSARMFGKANTAAGLVRLGQLSKETNSPPAPDSIAA